MRGTRIHCLESRGSQTWDTRFIFLLSFLSFLYSYFSRVALSCSFLYDQVIPFLLSSSFLVFLPFILSFPHPSLLPYHYYYYCIYFLSFVYSFLLFSCCSFLFIPDRLSYSFPSSFLVFLLFLPSFPYPTLLLFYYYSIYFFYFIYSYFSPVALSTSFQ